MYFIVGNDSLVLGADAVYEVDSGGNLVSLYSKS